MVRQYAAKEMKRNINATGISQFRDAGLSLAQVPSTSQTSILKGCKGPSPNYRLQDVYF